jgi:hypothetical protein
MKHRRLVSLISVITGRSALRSDGTIVRIMKAVIPEPLVRLSVFCSYERTIRVQRSGAAPKRL